MITYKKIVFIMGIGILVMLVFQAVPSYAVTYLQNGSFENPFTTTDNSQDCYSVTNNWCGFNYQSVQRTTQVPTAWGSYTVRFSTSLAWGNGWLTQSVNYPLEYFQNLNFYVYPSSGGARVTLYIFLYYQATNTIGHYDYQYEFNQQVSGTGQRVTITLSDLFPIPSWAYNIYRIDIYNENTGAFYIDDFQVNIYIPPPPPPCPTYPYC